MTAYSEAVRDHFENPRNVGEIPDADAVGYETNPVCGDTMRLTLRINGGRIVEARFQASGCPAAMAAASVCTERVRGLSLAEAEAITKEQYAGALGGLPAGKMHCSVLAADAVKAAAADYRRRAAP
ncbi:MAG TPA: iron-sulfur cluster assembly scaffold protein [Dehalococcoidia bacterium]|nr:iron-sulfur cluster assembly scaffold protein [Dehalococcoidia bacterium]